MANPRNSRTSTEVRRAWAVRGTKMSENTATAPATTDEIVVRESVLSQAKYIRANAGVDVDTLSFEEILELQTRFYSEWQSSDSRKAERDQAKLDRERDAAAKREAREAERADRLKAEKAKLEAKLAKLAGK